MKPSRKDYLALHEARGYYGIIWIVWDDVEGGIEGAVVGEASPDNGDYDAEYAVVHAAVEPYWRASPVRAHWVRDGFWFEGSTAAKKALTVGRKALKEYRAFMAGRAALTPTTTAEAEHG